MNKETIKKIIEELLSKMNFEVERIETAGSEKEPKFLIIAKDARLLIGKNGETFSSFVHLARKLVENKVPVGEKIDFCLDINNYQAEKVQGVYNKIQVLVERARTLKTEVELAPMPAYERMIVHEALGNIPDIKTESVGDGASRRVVIKYVRNK